MNSVATQSLCVCVCIDEWIQTMHRLQSQRPNRMKSANFRFARSFVRCRCAFNKSFTRRAWKSKWNELKKLKRIVIRMICSCGQIEIFYGNCSYTHKRQEKTEKIRKLRFVRNSKVVNVSRCLLFSESLVCGFLLYKYLLRRNDAPTKRKEKINNSARAFQKAKRIRIQNPQTHTRNSAGERFY